MSAPTGPRVLVLDTASLYYRAFFGLPDTFKGVDGTVVNALRGLVDFIALLTVKYEPEVVIAAWDDDWRPAWRVELLETYKTHRLASGTLAEETPELLSAQIPLIRDVLALTGVPVVGARDFEADDVAAAIVEHWPGPVDVVTGDRDLFQLVDDDTGVRVLYTARGVSRHDVVDGAWIRAKYGIEPRAYVDFAVMRGDTSDGIPGVPGIGDKTAAALLDKFETLDGIRAAAEDPASSITPRIRRNIIDSADYIERALAVVTTRRDALDHADYALTPFDDDRRAAFTAFGEQYGLGGAAERLLRALSRPR